jgi:D-cysteine desulfhydrase
MSIFTPLCSLSGIALGIGLLRLPWEVTAVMLAGDVDYYRRQQRMLTNAYLTESGSQELNAGDLELPIAWIDRSVPRRFGNVLPGEIRQCHVVGLLPICG